MLPRSASYQALRREFRWQVPARFNIARAVCDQHAAARPDAPALIFEDHAGSAQVFSFAAIHGAANRLANALQAHGLRRGDRVAILLPQTPETAIAHVAVYKAGLVAVPLFVLFGPDALEYRLVDSGARALITDSEGAERVAAIRGKLTDLRTVIAVGGGPAALAWSDLLGQASDRFSTIDTAADDPAIIIYTSGTTGPPKGALHAHRLLLGHMPGVEFPHEFFPQPGDRFWTPADWAWIGGLYDVLMPAWLHGVSVVAHRFRKFDPEAALALMARQAIRNVFMPPTALKIMRQADLAPDPGVRLRSVGSGGETLGEELLDWGRRVLGVTINEFYGQTECNLVVGNCASLMEVRPGSMGRAVPGHEVAIVDEHGTVLPPDRQGHIAIKRPDPVMFLGYWNNPTATAQKFAGDWLLTGDLGRQDQDGYLWYLGRSDDVITSAGYRIGPAEIEDCLIRHPAVAMAAAIGVPDTLRTEIVKAFVVLKPGVAGDGALADSIRAHVRTRLAAHEYPREIEFVDALPLTTTGKIMRRELRARDAAKRGA